MKPSIPERGIVIGLYGDIAKVILSGGETCKGCGQAKIGLCKSDGLNMVVEAKNIVNARIGDQVVVGIDESVRIRGYFFAFVIPLLSLIGGTIAGMFLNRYLLINGLDAIAGMTSIVITLFISLRSLKSLDRIPRLVVKTIL